MTLPPSRRGRVHRREARSCAVLTVDQGSWNPKTHVGQLAKVKSCQSYESLSVSSYLSHSEGKQLSSQTKRLQNLLEAVPDALVGMDETGVIRFVNQQTESLFGYERDDLIGQPVQTLVPEYLGQAYAEHQVADFADPSARSTGFDPPLNGRHQDGTELPANIRLSRIGTGDVLLVITAAREVTKHEQALEDSELLAAIIKNSNDAIIAKMLDGIVTFWNPAATRMYGYSREEMIGQSIELLCPQERTGEIETILARIKTGLFVEHLETIRVRKDGAVFPVLLTVSPIRDTAGTVVGASSFSRHLTKEKEAFESARSMIESSLDSLVAISAEGLITDVNEATVKVTGIPRQELIGTAFSDCFTEPQKAKAIYNLVFEQGMAVDYPLTMRHRDGTLTEVLYNASVYRDAGGKVLGVFAAARDVTKQNRAQQEIAEQRVNELDRLAELEHFQRLTVGRELKMIELKKEIERLQTYGRAGGGKVGDEY